jgi:hypothetical protein
MKEGFEGIASDLRESADTEDKRYQNRLAQNPQFK